MSEFDRPPWPHQSRGLSLAREAERNGFHAICVTCPTGGGKRRMITLDAQQTVAEGGRPAVFTNRRLITKQTRAEFFGHGIDIGVVASGYSAPMGQAALIVSVQTCRARGGLETMPRFTRAYIDEAHNRAFDHVVQYCREKGIPVHGYTATPLGIGDLYETLVVAGTTSELRACGALVKCHVYSPEQPYLKGVKRTKTGEFFQPQLRKMFAQYRTDVFGNVLDWWQQLNPLHAPTLLWAPGIDESRWFVEEFSKVGIVAAHIDGETDEAERERILNGSRDGDIPIVSSYGVLREGADLPWVSHGILVQVCGALKTFLQIAGRLLRAYEGKTHCILQDHAGCFWRHLSPNMDREWKLEDTDASVAKELHTARQEKRVQEPIRCPKCGGERLAGPKCPHCGHMHERSVRLVRMLDGTLKRQTGDIVRKKKQVNQDDRMWKTCLYAAASRGRTLTQAAGDFYRRAGHTLPQTMQPQPAPGSSDWFLRAADVYPWLAKRKKATP